MHRSTVYLHTRDTEVKMAERQTATASSRQEERLAHRDAVPARRQGAYGTLQRVAEEMDRIFDDFGLGRGWIAPRGAQNFYASDAWAPDVEVLQRGDELVIRADLPGLSKDDIKVDVKDDAVIIQGERRQQREEERQGIYRSERIYGSFQRSIPVPDGAITDQAKAHFSNGVLEVVMPAPPEHVTRGRRLEISEHANPKK
jgi:HSP20 family protein